MCTVCVCAPHWEEEEEEEEEEEGRPGCIVDCKVKDGGDDEPRIDDFECDIQQESTNEKQKEKKNRSKPLALPCL